MSTAIDQFGPFSGPAATYAGTKQDMEKISSDDAVARGPMGLRALTDPGNPLMWFAGLLLITVGAAGVAGSVRLGPVRASASAGKG